jgi:hypothetical protein
LPEEVSINTGMTGKIAGMTYIKKIDGLNAEAFFSYSTVNSSPINYDNHRRYYIIKPGNHSVELTWVGLGQQLKENIHGELTVTGNKKYYFSSKKNGDQISFNYKVEN